MINWIIYGLFLLIIIVGIYLFRQEKAETSSTKIYRLRRLSEYYHSELIRNPFSMIKESIRKEKVNREIFEAIGFIRNLIAANRGLDISADLLLEQLAAEDGILKPAYTKALSLLRVNKISEMIEVFSATAGTKFASDFIRIVIRWETVSPDKLASTLLSYQSAMKEIRTTKLKRRAEILSDLVFLPVIANVIFIFFNFIIVGYFLGQREFLEQVFY